MMSAATAAVAAAAAGQGFYVGSAVISCAADSDV
jgi:hypothetical protein